MRRKYRSLLILIACLYQVISLHATHIVGGEMTYRCLGDDNYELTLTVYRDCFNGIPDFDDPAAVGVFDANNQLVQVLEIPYDSLTNDTLTPILSDPCFVVPPVVCVHRAVYIDTLSLPFSPGGYQVAYQRCCRNVTIANLIVPEDVGATFGIEITEEALLSCDDSPIFNFYPPIYICVNEPINFDQSAFDAEGDSIVYKLCTPFTGGTPQVPIPNPPSNPPYQEVPWLSPPYGVDNMLNGSPGSPVLAIDPVTGVLTGTPNTIGQFLVGVCAESYRDGELVATIRRDFQFNVGVCGEPAAAFFSPSIQCGSLEVDVFNESTGTDSYLWDFGEFDDDTDTSLIANPTYIYSDTGTYEITLIVEPNTICSDTATATITLLPDVITPIFEIEVLECSDTVVIQTIDLTTSPTTEIVAWNWTIQNGTGSIVASSSDSLPTFVLFDLSVVNIELEVTAANGCLVEYSELFQIPFINEDLLTDTLLTCPGVEVPLNPFVNNPEATFQWSPATGLDDPNAASPVAITNEDITYQVVVADDNCEITREITLLVYPEVEAIAPADTTICDAILPIIGSSPTAVQYFWATDSAFDDIIAEDSIALVEPIGTETYYLLARDTNGCAAIDSLTIIGNGVNLELEYTPLICENDSVLISAVITDPSDNVSYIWSPDSVIISGHNTNEVLVFIPETGSQFITLNTENQLGCQRLDSIPINIVVPEPVPDFISDQQCEGLEVQFFNQSPNAPYYLWDFGDNSNPNDTSTAENPFYVYPQPGTYFVTLTLPAADECADTIVLPIEVNNTIIHPDFDYELIGCGDTVTVAFNNLSLFAGIGQFNFQWEFSDGQTSMFSEPEVTFIGQNEITATMSIVTNDGCSASYSENISLNPVELSLPDTMNLCLGDSIELNPSGNANWLYSWSPSIGLIDGNAPNPIASPDQSTTYIVTAQIANAPECVNSDTVFVEVLSVPEFEVIDTIETCSNSATIVATSNEILNFNWSTNNSFDPIISNGDSIEYLFQLQETLYLQGINSVGCSLIDSIFLQNQGVNISMTDSVFLCQPDTITIESFLFGNENEVIYEWTSNADFISSTTDESAVIFGDSNSFVAVSIENGFGCIAVDTTFIIIDTIEILLPDTLSHCGEEEVEIELAANSISNVINIQWIPANLIIEGQGTSSISVNALMDSFITVSVTNSTGCTQMDSVSLINNAIDVELPDTILICESDEISLLAEIFNNGIITNIEWSSDAEIISGQGAPEAIFFIENESLINIVVENEFECSAFDTASIEFGGSTFNISIAPELDTVFVGDSTRLVAVFGENYEYEWLPTESLFFDDQPYNPLAFPTETTIYEVIVRDSSDCNTSAEATVVVLNRSCIDPFIFVPTGFTPNNDGKNDFAEVFGNNIEAMTFIIYNRWGEKVFESTDQNIKWDGTFRGNKLPPDSYGYYLEVECIGGERYAKKGNITLVR